MKAILTHQSSINNGRQVLVIDGERSEYTGKPEQEEALKLAYPQSGMEKQYIPFRLFLGIPSSFEAYIGNNQMLISSNFLSTDEKGRKIAYTFYVDSLQKPAYIRRLFEDSSIVADMQPNPNECKVIEDLASNKYKKMFICGVLIVILILILLLIF